MEKERENNIKEAFKELINGFIIILLTILVMGILLKFLGILLMKILYIEAVIVTIFLILLGIERIKYLKKIEQDMEDLSLL